MAIDSYYIGRDKIDTKGLCFFLKQLQERDASGGGRALLGSIVDYIDALFQITYVVPASITTPQILLLDLQKRKNDYGIQGDITLKTSIAAGTATTKLTKKSLFSAGVGPFPSIPLGASLSLDFNRIKSVTYEHGTGSYYEYIPMGYLGKIYSRVKGRPTQEIGGKLLTREAVVVECLFAKNYSVVVESTEKFSSDFAVKLDAFNALPNSTGKVAISKATETTLKAEVSGDTYYLVALFSALWADIARAVS
ncbi:MAG TPA: hypothetical protein PLU30_17150 [Verrucomicrobiae bacterium]|nr:hypothetical protein [Verrucomicrobiae bacterium]